MGEGLLRVSASERLIARTNLLRSSPLVAGVLARLVPVHQGIGSGFGKGDLAARFRLR